MSPFRSPIQQPTQLFTIRLWQKRAIILLHNTLWRLVELPSYIYIIFTSTYTELIFYARWWPLLSYPPLLHSSTSSFFQLISHASFIHWGSYHQHQQALVFSYMSLWMKVFLRLIVLTLTSYYLLEKIMVI